VERAVLRHARDRDDGLSQWLNVLSERKHANVVIVALANETARVAWAMVRNETVYHPSLESGSQAV
jgi:transposase